VAEFLFTIAAVVFLCAALLVMAYLYNRERTSAVPPERDTQQDLANTMILLQTMRDVLEEQKELARAFNEGIDKKIAYIRKAVDEIAAERKRLRAAGTGQVEPATEELPEALADMSVVDGPPEEPAAPLSVFPEPDVDSDFIDGWAGLDLGGTKEGSSEALYEPVNAEEAENARDAVRSLLDFSGAGFAEPSEALIRMPAAKNGNGATPPALHSRVYEYHDAGMTVPQIAQELGIGKGEVRLMLSLRKDRER